MAYAQQVDRRIEVPTGHYYSFRAHLVQPQGDRPHLRQISNLQPSENSGFVHVWRNHIRQPQELLGRKTNSRLVSKPAPEENFRIGSRTNRATCT